MPNKIERLSLGGVLDRAITLTRDNFKRLFVLTLGIFTCAVVANLLSPVTMRQAIQGHGSLPLNPHTRALLLLQTFNLLCVFPLTHAAIIFAISEAYLGHPINVARAIKRSFSLFFPVVITGLIYYLALFGGFILCVVPGILCAFWFALITEVVVIERVWGIAAFKRSKILVRGHFGDLCVIGVVVFALIIMVNLGAAFVPEIHLRAFAAAFIQSGLTSLLAAILVVFYFSCRCERDNFDLQLLADSIGADPNPPAPPRIAGP